MKWRKKVMNCENEQTVLQHDIDWRNWLEPQSMISNYCDLIKENSKKLYKQNEGILYSLPFFTTHDDNHCGKVEDCLHRLIPGYLWLSFNW